MSLKPTGIGRRWLRRDPRLTVFVYVRTRDTAGERGEVSFQSRIRSMRALLVLALALLTPASAQAGTIAREGTELVYRSAPGEADRVNFENLQPTLVAEGRLTAGPGCRQGDDAAYCPLEGVTSLRVLAGDGDDEILVLGGKVVVDLGPGDDEFAAGTRTPWSTAVRATTTSPCLPNTVQVGPSTPRVARATTCSPWPAATARSRSPAARVTIASPRTGRVPRASHSPAGTATTPTRWSARSSGGRCAPFLAGITASTVSRAFQEGALTAAAYGTVSLRRAKGRYDRPREVLARGSFSADPGPLRVSLDPTVFGKRWLRRHEAPKVHVTVRLRSGAERGTIVYRSKLG